jgi:hypothetical protein
MSRVSCMTRGVAGLARFRPVGAEAVVGSPEEAAELCALRQRQFPLQRLCHLARFRGMKLSDCLRACEFPTRFHRRCCWVFGDGTAWEESACRGWEVWMQA